MALFLFVPIGRPFNPNRSLISQNCSLYKIALCINIYRTLFHSQKRKWLMTNDHNDWNCWSLCFMLAASMFHVCGLYVSCLRPLSTTHGYDKGRIAFWGARKRLGALAVLCSFERRACKQRGWIRALDSCFGARAFRSCFSWFVLWFVLFGRSFRGSCFSVVLFVVRTFGRSFCGSFFSWFVLLGARMCFLFDALKFLEACVARSDVS